jgi:hypothetical protein
MRNGRGTTWVCYSQLVTVHWHMPCGGRDGTADAQMAALRAIVRHGGEPSGQQVGHLGKTVRRFGERALSKWYVAERSDRRRTKYEFNDLNRRGLEGSSHPPCRTNVFRRRQGASVIKFVKFVLRRFCRRENEGLASTPARVFLASWAPRPCQDSEERGMMRGP